MYSEVMDRQLNDHYDLYTDLNNYIYMLNNINKKKRKKDVCCVCFRLNHIKNMLHTL